MKFIYNNINDEKYIIKFHDVHLYLQKNKKLQYLFTNNIHIYKKYIIDINYYDFQDFVKECIELQCAVETKNNFEFQYTSVVETKNSFELQCAVKTETKNNFELQCAVETKNNFELQCVQLVEKLVTTSNIDFKLYCCKKLGSLILLNYIHKDFKGLKPLHKLFTFFVSESDIKINSLNSQIRYLIIILNNLIEVSKHKIKIKKIINNQSLYDQNSILDFIYDYYEN